MRNLRSLFRAVLLLLLVTTACSDNSPRVPSGITLNVDAVTLVTIGATKRLTATVRDQDGDPVDQPVTWTSSAPTIASVDSTGVVTARGVGKATVTASSGSDSADVDVTVVLASKIEIAAGNGQTAKAGTAVPVPPAVRVLNAAGQPVAGVTVEFQLTGGAGKLTGESKTTGADGIAAVDSWVMGPTGVNTLSAIALGGTVSGAPIIFSATTDKTEGWNVRLEYLGGAPPPPAIALAFARAEVRWEKIITGDLPDVTLALPGEPCGTLVTGFEPVAETVDDLLLQVRFIPIDGPGEVLAQGGFCIGREVGGQPVFGIMQFDIADLNDPQAVDIITHEMGHALGIGDDLWTRDQLLADPVAGGGTDPHFVGVNAISAFDAAGGLSYIQSAKVPVENQFGPGTRDSHWREEVFGNELMTGLINAGKNPLSAITIASLADEGYTVNLAAAEPYTLPRPSSLSSVMLEGRSLGDDVLRPRIRYVDPAGRVVRVVDR